jgi:hypothetical protein
LYFTARSRLLEQDNGSDLFVWSTSNEKLIFEINFFIYLTSSVALNLHVLMESVTPSPANVMVSQIAAMAPMNVIAVSISTNFQ